MIVVGGQLVVDSANKEPAGLVVLAELVHVAPVLVVAVVADA